MTKTKKLLESLKVQPMTLKQLSEVLGLTHEEAARMVMYMQRRDYIESISAPVLYTLSAKGEKRRAYVPKTSAKKLAAKSAREKAMRRMMASTREAGPSLATVWGTV